MDMNELINKYATNISKITGITTIGDIELQLHHLLAEVDILETIENELVSEIEWDNWTYQPDDKRYIEGSDNYWKVPQVLHCKLEWLEEYLLESMKGMDNNECNDLEVHLNTVEQTIKLLNILAGGTTK